VRRTIALLLGLSFAATPLMALAREFDFTKPAPQNQFTPPPGTTRLIPPPNLGPAQPGPPAAAPTADGPEALPESTPLRPAQRFDLNATQYDLPQGTKLPATVLRELTYAPGDAVTMTLEVSDDVRDGQGEVIIPKGSTVWGSFQPVFSQPKQPARRERRTRNSDAWPDGSRFVAERVSIGDRIYPLKAQTELLATQQDPRRDVGGEAGNGALIGAAGGLLIGVLTGGIGFIPVLAGGAVGATAGAVGASQPVVIVKPDRPLVLTLVEPLRIR